MRKEIYGVVGCGWLGTPVAEDWISQGKIVHGTTTSPEKIEQLQKKGIHTHLLTKENYTQQEWLNQCDVLLLNIPPSSLKENYGNYLLKIVQQLNSSAKIIFIGSTSVYANKNQIVTEDDPLDGTMRNAAFLIEAEKILSDFSGDRLTILRMSGLVGEDRNPVKYMSGRTISGGNEPVNLIHQEDCIRLINFVLENSIWGEQLNAAAPKHPTKRDYYSFAANQLNMELPLFDEEEKEYKIIGNDKLTNCYGFNFRYLDPYTFPEFKY
ncbi:NAD(P)-binding domain-containing protein [Brumimicrobium aurantiacum]|uniref:6-phosphogluconate dehydrogenase NADP-binding domain-containing protein n=1 Tax=Brumimicrobium aurantiacum TaxID=1737063 RepID=A0A3E1F1Y6_9FLAO|nr:NAD(P)-binding domain-containing protein [Brumimicrobium aurantiacum]RFC55842.1 hypothetical protein DXU93_02580 [Brumimicrobium aurantiacum]